MLFIMSLIMLCILGFHFACESFINKHWHQLPPLGLTLAFFVYVLWTEVGPMGLSISLLFTCLFALVFIAAFSWSYFYLFSVVEKCPLSKEIQYEYYPPQFFKVILTMFMSIAASMLLIVLLLSTPLGDYFQLVGSVVCKEEYPLLNIAASQEELKGKKLVRTISFRYLVDDHEVATTLFDPSAFDFLETDDVSKVVLCRFSYDYIDTSVNPPYCIIKGYKTLNDVKFYLNPEDKLVSDLAFLNSLT